jgi:uncharacterized protein
MAPWRLNSYAAQRVIDNRAGWVQNVSMQPELIDLDIRERRVLGGKSAWIVTDGKAGMDVQAKGVADALGLAYEMKRVEPRGLARVFAPWGPVGAHERFGQPGSRFAPPWPVIAISTGRASIPYIRALRRMAGVATFTVVLQDPKSGPNTSDLIWVPEHDRLRGPNVITTVTSPHSFTQWRLAELRRELPEAIRALPKPIVAVILGGKNGTYQFSDADDDRLERALKSIGDLGASFVVTPSRRTHKRLLNVVRAATEGRPRIIWDGEEPNPYPNFLAAADWVVVTADSVNMTGEACATGRPVYVFEPGGGSAKFSRFHDALRRYGATRPLPPKLNALETWDYPPLDSASIIAAEIERRYARRAQMLQVGTG